MRSVTSGARTTSQLTAEVAEGSDAARVLALVDVLVAEGLLVRRDGMISLP